MDLLLALGDTGLVKADLGLRLYSANERQADLESAIVVTERATGDYAVAVPDDFSWYTLTYEYPAGVGGAKRFGQYDYPYEAPPNYILPLVDTGLAVGDMGLALYLDGADVTADYTLASDELDAGVYSLSGWPTDVPGRWLLRSSIGGLTFTHEWTVPQVVSSGWALEFADFMPDTCVAVPGILDEFGTFLASGTTLALPCRIEGEQRLVRDPSGQEVTSSVQVIVGGYNDLTVEGWRYTLPVRYTPRLDLRAVAIDKESDEEGPCFETLHLP